MTISKEKTPWAWGSGHYVRSQSNYDQRQNGPDYALYRILKAKLNESTLSPEEYDAALERIKQRARM